MLCLSGFELYSRWVPLLRLLAILSKKVNTKELFSSGGVSKNEVVALKLSTLSWKVALSSFRLKLSNSRAYLLQIFFYNSQELWLVT